MLHGLHSNLVRASDTFDFSGMRLKLYFCLVAERCWDQVRCAIEEYTWRFDGLRRRAPRRRRT
jgi:hypothetical protein